MVDIEQISELCTCHAVIDSNKNMYNIPVIQVERHLIVDKAHPPDVCAACENKTNS